MSPSLHDNVKTATLERDEKKIISLLAILMHVFRYLSI